MTQSDKTTWKAEAIAGPADAAIGWGSDVTAQMLRQLEIPFIALTPGASYRGLHDSLVNHLGNERPEMLVCLHEEHAVALAQGWAKVTGRAMAVALHSNVGLMHATMAIFNAFSDRTPMLILGATGPLDAAKRRPWIDWLHTAQDQAALVRPFLKWDDQPGSTEALPEAMLRGWKIAHSGPCGPVYVNLDAATQEAAVAGPIPLPDPARFAPAAPTRPDAGAVGAAAKALAGAKAPVILFGRGARTDAAMAVRVALAERLGAAMCSDLKAGAMVPSDHPLHVGVPFNKLSEPGKAAIRGADVILSLGSIDLGGMLHQAFGADAPSATIIHAGQDQHLQRGRTADHYGLAPVDVEMLCDADAAAAEILAALPNGTPARPVIPAAAAPAPAGALGLRDVAAVLRNAVGDTPVSFASLARGWPVDLWPHRAPLDYLGKDGGGGVGSGPGLTIGAALALRGSGRFCVGVLGDGDTLMGINALWTAAKYRIPALFIVANNRSYFNDELHQERVAERRGRNPANAWVGQQLDNPAPDLAGLARAQGIAASGPVADRAALTTAIAQGVAALRAGQPYLIDVLIEARQGREDAVPRGT